MLKVASMSSCKPYPYAACNTSLPKLNKASLLRLKSQMATKDLTSPRKQKQCTENHSGNNHTNNKGKWMETFEANPDGVAKDNVHDKHNKCNKNALVNTLSNDNETLIDTSGVIGENLTTIHIPPTEEKEYNKNPSLNLSIGEGKLVDNSRTTQQDSSTTQNICNENLSLNISLHDKEEREETREEKENKHMTFSHDRVKVIDTSESTQQYSIKSNSTARKQKTYSCISSLNMLNDRGKLIEPSGTIHSDTMPTKKKKKSSQNPCITNLLHDKKEQIGSSEVTQDATSPDHTPPKKQKKCSQSYSVDNLPHDKEKLLDISVATLENTSRDHAATKKQGKYSQNTSINNLSKEKEKLVDASKATEVSRSRNPSTTKKQRKCSQNTSENNMSNDKEKLIDASEVTVEAGSRNRSPIKKKKKSSQSPCITSLLNEKKEQIGVSGATRDAGGPVHTPTRKLKKSRQNSFVHNLTYGKEKLLDISVPTLEDTSRDHGPTKKQRKCSQNTSENNDKKKSIGASEVTEESRRRSRSHSLTKKKKPKQNPCISNPVNDKEELIDTSEAIESLASSDHTSTPKQKISRQNSSIDNITDDKEKLLDISVATPEDTSMDHAPTKKQRKYSQNHNVSNLSTTKEKLMDSVEATEELKSRNHPPTRKKKSIQNPCINNRKGSSGATQDTASLDHKTTRKQKKCSQNSSIDILPDDKEKLIDSSEVIQKDTHRDNAPKKKQKKTSQNTINISKDEEKLIATSNEEAILNTKETCPCGVRKPVLQTFTGEYDHKRSTFHIVCTICGQSFHARCINLTKGQANKLILHKIPYTCILCLAKKLKHIDAIRDKLSDIVGTFVVQEQQEKESEPPIPVKPNLEDDPIVDDPDKLCTNVDSCEFIEEVTESEPKSVDKDEDHNSILDKLISNLSSSGDIKYVFAKDCGMKRMLPNKEHYIWDEFY